MSIAAPLLPRRWRHDERPSAAASTRLQVCPPEAWPQAPGLAARLLAWLANGAAPGLRSATRHQSSRLAEAGEDFERAIDDLHTHAADEMRLRIGRARSLRELWHLRASLFVLVARARGEAEAERRLATLNRYFPTRAPRSGFAALPEHA